MSRRHIERYDDIGTRLLPTAHATLMGIVKSGTKGTLVGFGCRPNTIRVLKDGIKTPYTYHAKFWRRAQTFKEKEPVQ